MSGNRTRIDAIASINSYEGAFSDFNYLDDPSGDLFGTNVFSLDTMKEVLPKNVYKSVKKTIESSGELDLAIADAVADAMKNWALSKGATHYAHVFHPLTGRTAEKHDSFFEPDGNQKIAEFSGALLIRQEPDGSSFPSGGLRQTHSARAYTAWDITSPAYIIENVNGSTLCIPTVFISWTGEALDYKTPLLRSMQALDKQANRVLRLFGHQNIAPVAATAGAEQEYFLVDKNFALSRPDLFLAKRTLFGAAPAKGQEFDDHYFGAINERVQAYMMDVDRELYKLGIPVKTRHNEVAPGQYEIAPVFETANLAADHQQLVMMFLERIADKHGFLCTLHEKPFKGINGSGKHVNFSLGSATQGNLLNPGANPHDNAQFLTFATAVIRAVYRHGGLMRAAIASASNDHRLGANEAPPAIISIYLGEQLADVFAQLKDGKPASSQQAKSMKLGVDTLPVIKADAGDRNRTSPFAFTGNRFEFRAVGSSQSISRAVTVLNTIIAESLDYIATKLESLDGDFFDNVQTVLQEVVTDSYSIIFNGNGYSSEWHEEAENVRGLLNLRTTVDALPHWTVPSTIEAFEKYNVLTQSELESRKEVYLEQYIKTLNVEGQLMLKMGRTQIFPAAIRYQSQLATSADHLKALDYSFDTITLDKITAMVKNLQDSLNTLEVALAHEDEDYLAHATHMRDVVIPAMNAVREVADELEGFIADDLWTLPTYQEMLFIR